MSDVIQITSNIINQSIVDKTIVSETEHVIRPDLLKRPLELSGNTYKLKSPLIDHSIYVTINNIEIDGKLWPFEIFLNSKDMRSHGWVIALTRVLSSVFRLTATHDLNVSFLVRELRSVFDADGGYVKQGKRIPSVVSELGDILNTHLIKIGVIVEDKDKHMELYLIEKRKEAEDSNAIKNASNCNKCGAVAVVLLDNCQTCLECGDSKCG